MLKRSILSAAILASISGTAFAAPAYIVTTDADSGGGSLREALGSGASVITIAGGVGDIVINDTLEYDSENPLKIIGSGQTIIGGDFTLFAATEGADLEIINLSFEGPGIYDENDNPTGYDLDNQGGGNAILVDVPLDREGVVQLRLANVGVSGVGDHGILMSDCDELDCGAGQTGTGDGSDASIHAVFSDVTVIDSGWGKPDGDGVRLNERDLGGIIFEATHSSFNNNGADGIELDEADEGDVMIAVRNVELDQNGAFCRPLPDDESDAEEPYEERCYDDGEIDLDDAFDIDEDGDGSILGWIAHVWATGNLDEGIDFDEAGPGGFDLALSHIEGWNNGDEAIKTSEEGDGDLVLTLSSVTAGENGNDGMQLEEDDDGNVDVVIQSTDVMMSEGDGIKVEEDDDGDLNLAIRGVNSTENEDAGILAAEDNDGDFTMTVNGTVTAGNGDVGIDAEQDDAGEGTLRVRGSNISDGIATTGVDEI